VCKGPIKASSESLTHAAIYRSDKKTNAIIHVHNLNIWTSLIDTVPTTLKHVQYGTPEMAYEIMRLFKETNFREKIIVMAGHKSGIITFGNNLKEAGKVLLDYYHV
jgi:ribulose-5-phosphate 4-epimerase/fuculose-1-phosphate aldolase